MTQQKIFRLGLILCLLFPATGFSQFIEKVSFDAADGTNGYYLAIPPASHTINGVLVFFCSFRPPENLLPETRLHNIAAANDLLTVYVSLGSNILANDTVTTRINTILQHIAARYKADTAKFVLGGFDLAGTIVLRYTELAYEHPARFALQPKAVFGVASIVDLPGLYKASERQIKRNYFPPTTGDARAYLDLLTKEEGTLTEHPENYKKLSPFYHDEEKTGNEQFLKNVAVRLYYDTDVAWQLNTRRNSLYDTGIPEGSELIDRLLLAGNTNAEFIASKTPGIRSTGMRNTSSLSIVDETDCIQWIIRKLHIFNSGNPMAWEPPYHFPLLNGWRMERAAIPGPISTHMTIKGIEDIRFPPGWGNANSEEYWSVAYLLWLERGQKIDAGILQNNLKIYYDDLLAGAQVRRDLKIAAGVLKPVQVSIKKIKAEPDDLETYTGVIDMFDYLGQKPIALNYLVHLKACGGQGHIPVFFEISPKPFEHPIWQDLKKSKQKFICGE
jgi:hypothetical protein